MTTLDQIFERARNRRRAAFIAYVMAGDPDLATTLSVLNCLSAAGSDLIELGVPYGDPLADGPTIAAAAQRALENGTRLADVFALLKRHRETGGAPVVLFTYFNPVYQYGIDRFTQNASEAGAIGIIVPDLALDESLELRASVAARGLQMPLLVAPTTSRERAARIAESATGFVYVVSRLGVTGANGMPNVTQVRRQVAMLRDVTTKPLAVGFGISSAGGIREVASIADGVIVGSALIDAYAGKSGSEATRSLRTFVEPLVAATAWEGGVTLL
ncbi:MAG TPA: tryptophan synthase subunit alpha [Candidatus Cybelea sp.]|jgi:tryptophan synthase alpha chain|nr:tryptophan synthase subunit alpha [Candidatus Cybelea sp.]